MRPASRILLAGIAYYAVCFVSGWLLWRDYDDVMRRWPEFAVGTTLGAVMAAVIVTFRFPKTGDLSKAWIGGPLSIAVGTAASAVVVGFARAGLGKDLPVDAFAVAVGMLLFLPFGLIIAAVVGVVAGKLEKRSLRS